LIFGDLSFWEYQSWSGFAYFLLFWICVFINIFEFWYFRTIK